MFIHHPNLRTCCGLLVAASLALTAGCKADGIRAESESPVTPIVDTPAVGVTPPPTTGTPPPATEVPPTTYTPVTSLPAVAALSNVRVEVNGGSATIKFDAVDAARDYRVYALPADSNIRLGSDGSVVIPNAVYRCAGTYQVPVPLVDDAQGQNNGINTRVIGVVNGYSRTLAEATLGQVYTTQSAANDLLPVYVVGNPQARADDNYYFRYNASRDKKYTTSYSEYVQLVASGWRDDGIAFYVPSTAGADTRPVLTNTNLGDPQSGVRYFLNQGAELNFRNPGGFSAAFNVLASPAAGTRPLMRVFYQPFGGRSHDELAVGQAEFTRIWKQGLDNPATVLHYSGITQETSLVVEALDQGCPFQGHVASRSIAQQTIQFQTYSVTHQPWFSIADIQKVAPNAEVYVNGQHAGAGTPKAIARAFVKVSPKAGTQMDWMSSVANFSEPFTELTCDAPDGNCFQHFHLRNSTYDAGFYYAETNRWQVGTVLGQFLVNYADWASDTNGKFRLTVRNQKANIASNTFVHATMEVNAVGSGRRYPQLILSDQEIPVQFNLINGRSIILQTFDDFPSRVDLEVCDHKNWDVNQQCPRFIFRYKYDSAGTATAINPVPEPDTFMSALDAPTRFDLYVSNSRAYILVNNKPYGCANLSSNSGVAPRPIPPTGPVTVTFGDVLYHSGADDNFLLTMQGGFINRSQLKETSRHFDNLGFSSGVAAPAWDEARIPCSSVMTSLDYDPAPG